MTDLTAYQLLLFVWALSLLGWVMFYFVQRRLLSQRELALHDRLRKGRAQPEQSADGTSSDNVSENNLRRILESAPPIPETPDDLLPPEDLPPQLGLRLGDLNQGEADLSGKGDAVRSADRMQGVWASRSVGQVSDEKEPDPTAVSIRYGPDESEAGRDDADRLEGLLSRLQSTSTVSPPAGGINEAGEERRSEDRVSHGLPMDKSLAEPEAAPDQESQCAKSGVDGVPSDAAAPAEPAEPAAPAEPGGSPGSPGPEEATAAGGIGAALDLFTGPSEAGPPSNPNMRKGALMSRLGAKGSPVSGSGSSKEESTGGLMERLSTMGAATRASRPDGEVRQVLQPVEEDEAFASLFGRTERSPSDKSSAISRFGAPGPDRFAQKEEEPDLVGTEVGGREVGGRELGGGSDVPRRDLSEPALERSGDDHVVTGSFETEPILAREVLSEPSTPMREPGEPSSKEVEPSLVASQVHSDRGSPDASIPLRGVEVLDRFQSLYRSVVAEGETSGVGTSRSRLDSESAGNVFRRVMEKARRSSRPDKGTVESTPSGTGNRRETVQSDDAAGAIEEPESAGPALARANGESGVSGAAEAARESRAAGAVEAIEAAEAAEPDKAATVAGPIGMPEASSTAGSGGIVEGAGESSPNTNRTTASPVASEGKPTTTKPPPEFGVIPARTDDTVVRGLRLVQEGRFDEAAELYRRRAEESSAESDFFGLGEALLKGGRSREAIDAWERMLARFPSGSYSFAVLDELLRLSARPQRPLKRGLSFRRREPITSRAADPFSTPAADSASSGEKSSIESFMDNVLPEDRVVFAGLARQYQDPDPSCVTSLVAQELRRSQDRWDLWAYLATLYAQSGRIQESRDIFTFLKRRFPAEARYRYYLGLLFWSGRNFPSAAEQWRQGLELCPRGLLRSKLLDRLRMLETT